MTAGARYFDLHRPDDDGTPAAALPLLIIYYCRYVTIYKVCTGEGGACWILLSVCTSTPSPGGRPFLALWHQRS